MKNPKRKSVSVRESMSVLAVILGCFALAGSVTAEKAEAGVVTADSTAWTNDGLTGEIGLDYRAFDIKRSRTVHIPAVMEHGQVIVPARDIKVPFTVRPSGLSGSGKVSGRLGSDVLVGIGYGGKLYGYTAVKNGGLVGSIGGTAFNSDRSQLFGSVAFSPIKNTAVFADFRQSQTSYGVQQQLGNAFVYGAYSPNTNGYAAGIGLEIGSRTEAPVKVAVPSDLVCPSGYDQYDGGCVKTIPAPTRIAPAPPIDPAPSKGYVRGRG